MEQNSEKTLCEGLFYSRIVREANEKYAKYRIPGMIVTQRGTLLIYFEARRDASDWAMMDIVLLRSTDFGKSFGEETILAAGTEAHKTVNNPVTVQDKNGRIHFLYCEDYGVDGGRILRRYSDDDGITWSDTVDITEYTLPEYRNCFAVGPGHGICTNSGRLIFPVWMVPRSYGSYIHSHGPSVISTLYSDDNGESWAVGDILGTTETMINPNETAAAQLSDGSVYLNIRLGGKINYRGQAVSDNGYSAWRDYMPQKELIDPGSFGSLAVYDDGTNPKTLLFVNCEHKHFRKNVTVKGSLDDGKSWTLRRLLDAERGGYTEIAADGKNGLIYVLYEDKAGETDTLAVFDYKWLADGIKE